MVKIKFDYKIFIIYAIIINMGLHDDSKIFKSSGYCYLGHKNANNRKAGVKFTVRLRSVDTLQIGCSPVS